MTATSPLVSDQVTGGPIHLVCTGCGGQVDSEALWTVSPCCRLTLFARYDLDALSRSFRPADVRGRRWDLWRYAEVLPVREPKYRVSLGEGGTPLVETDRLGAFFGLDRLLIKDESQNPTGSFKARGMAVAVSRARELGATKFALPSAGNAGAAAAAYAAASGLQASVITPTATPAAMVDEVTIFGAQLEQVPGSIVDAAATLHQRDDATWFDLSTLREPYRVEGKKTMAYEIVEQLGEVPDVLIYPTGGGTGIVGMWKAFDEMQRLGWIDARRPRLIAVQSTGCAPIVRAWESNQRHAEPWDNPTTSVPGLRVPRCAGDYLILDAIRASSGAAIAIADLEALDMVRPVATLSGIFPCPEGAATAAAIPRLRERGLLDSTDTVVLFNTANGLKYRV